MASNSSLLHKPGGEIEWFSIMLQNNGLNSPLHLGEYGFLKHKETKLCHFHSLPVSHNWIFPKLDIGKKSVGHQAEPPILLCFVYLFKIWYWCFRPIWKCKIKKEQTYLNKVPRVERFHFKGKAIKSLKIYERHGKKM